MDAYLHQVKVMTEGDLLVVACEQFLGKSVSEIKSVVLQTLEGHLRSILGKFSLPLWNASLYNATGSPMGVNNENQPTQPPQ